MLNWRKAFVSFKKTKAGHSPKRGLYEWANESSGQPQVKTQIRMDFGCDKPYVKEMPSLS